jgi:hypothetical protein
MTPAVRVSNERVDALKYHRFHTALCAHGGRYTYNPRRYTDDGVFLLVDYEFDDATAYNKFCVDYLRFTTPIVEKVRKPTLLQRLRKLLTR